MKILKNLFALLIGLVFALLLCEIILHFYQPIPFRVKGDKIILPANQKYVISDFEGNDKLDSEIIHSKNSMGFRGDEKPQDWENYTSIVTVGGSTTECYYLSDGKDWPSVLGRELQNSDKNIWINNAGLDGHSTFGHQILLQDYLIELKPDYIVFLIGCNDVGRGNLSKFDKDKMQGEYQSALNWLSKNSEMVGLLENISRGIQAQQKNLTHAEVSLTTLKHLPENESIDQDIAKHQEFLLGYAKRIKSIIDDCRSNGIEPILLTQPTLVGEGMDPITKVNLETIDLMSPKGGKTYWTILELYNQVVRNLGQEEEVLVVDLAAELPKNSDYFYDGLHFTKQGAQKTGEIVARRILESWNSETKSSLQ